MISQSANYALRAIAFMSQSNDNKFYRVNEIAEQTNIPYFYLSKVMQRLAKSKLVVSASGPKGGFTLAKASKEISLLEIIQYIDGEDFLDRCVLGKELCNNDQKCPLHDTWLDMKTKLAKKMSKTSMKDIIGKGFWKSLNQNIEPDSLGES